MWPQIRILEVTITVWILWLNLMTKSVSEVHHFLFSGQGPPLPRYGGRAGSLSHSCTCPCAHTHRSSRTTDKKTAGLVFLDLSSYIPPTNPTFSFKVAWGSIFSPFRNLVRTTDLTTIQYTNLWMYRQRKNNICHHNSVSEVHSSFWVIFQMLTQKHLKQKKVQHKGCPIEATRKVELVWRSSKLCTFPVLRNSNIQLALFPIDFNG